MRNQVTIDLEAKDITNLVKDERFIPYKITNDNKFFSMAIAIGLVIIFTLVSVAQMIEWKPIDNFIAFQDIQRNFNNWTSVINDFQTLESNKIQTLVSSMSNYNQVTCVDYGAYYIPLFFNNITINSQNFLLPAAVRRGNGDGWSVTKSSTNDPAAFQQCLYVASELSDSTVTCGLDMYNKLGYGGYLNQGHWCNTARDKLYAIYKN